MNEQVFFDTINHRTNRKFCWSRIAFRNCGFGSLGNALLLFNQYTPQRKRALITSPRGSQVSESSNTWKCTKMEVFPAVRVVKGLSHSIFLLSCRDFCPTPKNERWAAECALLGSRNICEKHFIKSSSGRRTSSAHGRCTIRLVHIPDNNAL